MESNNKTTRGRRSLAKWAGAAVFLIFLVTGYSPRLHAQAFNDGGACGSSSALPCLGDFINPLTVTDTTPPTSGGPFTCNYDLLQIDLSQGKVFAHPYKKNDTSGLNCIGNITNAGATGLVDITNAVNPVGGALSPQTPFSGVTSGTISSSGTGPVTDGVFQVRNFHLQLPSSAGALNAFSSPCVYNQTINLKVSFVANADNTPVMLIASGTVAIDAGTELSSCGAGGGNYSGLIPGTGGAGGVGGYRGGNGGNGTSTPSNGATGLGPGGGLGGAVGCGNASAAVFLTTGVSAPPNSSPTVIPPGNDIATILRGGSGGGGGGGCASRPGTGGGGGGGAILIAASGTMTVNGIIDMSGAPGYNNYGSAGTGGIIRLVANTIAGSGRIAADVAPYAPNVSSDGGVIRFEAFSISFTGSTCNYQCLAHITTTSAPGQIVLPSAAPVTLQFASITDASNGANNCSITNTSGCVISANSQAAVGRSGSISSPDVTMPNATPTSPITSVNVVINAAPFSASSALTGKTVTLVVAPQDPVQGASKSYTQAIACSATCTATFSGVTLPLGFSSFSAFTVVNISAGGALSRLFPKIYQGEEIESVRLQTGGKETEYVLISKAGKEFPYKPGSGSLTVAAQGSASLPR